MCFYEKTDNELIYLAATSRDLDLLKQLANSQIMNVRRALSRNKNISSDIADKLLYDPVLNVSFLASMNPRTTKKRVFDEKIITPCVKCNVNELELDCRSCEYFKKI